MEIKQALFGYSNGHRLLTSSFQMGRVLQKNLETLTDLSGYGYTEDWDGYLTGYPFPEEGYFTLSKTWLAQEQERPGCAWVHTLFIPDQEMKFLPQVDLLPYFTRPGENTAIDLYQKDLSLDLGKARSLLSVPKNLNETHFVYQLFTGQRPVILGGKNAQEYGPWLWSLWSHYGSTWLKNKSFCSAVMKVKRLKKEPLSVEVCPKAKMKRILTSLTQVPDEIPTHLIDGVKFCSGHFLREKNPLFQDIISSVEGSEELNSAEIFSLGNWLAQWKEVDTDRFLDCLREISPKLPTQVQERMANHAYQSVVNQDWSGHFLGQLSISDELFHFFELDLLQAEALNRLNTENALVLADSLSSPYLNPLGVALRKELSYDLLWEVYENATISQQQLIISILKEHFKQESVEEKEMFMVSMFQKNKEDFSLALYQVFGTDAISSYYTWAKSGSKGESQVFFHQIHACNLSYSLECLRKNSNLFLMRGFLSQYSQEKLTLKKEDIILFTRWVQKEKPVLSTIEMKNIALLCHLPPNLKIDQVSSVSIYLRKRKPKFKNLERLAVRKFRKSTQRKVENTA